MVDESIRINNPKRRPLDERRVRAGLLLTGHTIASFARRNRVSRQLVWRLISGERPGLSGRSAAIRRKLEEVAA